MSLPRIFEITCAGSLPTTLTAPASANTPTGLQAWLNTLSLGVFSVTDYGLNVLGERMIHIAVTDSLCSISVLDRNEWRPLICRTVGSPKLGCTDPMAANYDPTATQDDGSCVLPVSPVPPVSNKLTAQYVSNELKNGQSDIADIIVLGFNPNNINSPTLLTDLSAFAGVAVYYQLTATGIALTIQNNSGANVLLPKLDFQITFVQP